MKRTEARIETGSSLEPGKTARLTTQYITDNRQASPAYCHGQNLPLHYIVLHCIALHYITLHYITLHCIALHYITLDTLLCIALYCIPPTLSLMRSSIYRIHFIASEGNIWLLYEAS